MVEILSLYNSISNSDKKLLENKVVVKEYRKGDILLIDGEIQHELYLVRKGLLMMYYDRDEKRKVVDFSYRNRFCVDIDSFSNQARSAYCIECMEESIVEIIHFKDLMELFDRSKEIERAYRILTEKVLSAVLKRHLDLSCLSIEDRFRQIVIKRSELFSLVPHKHIASYLNIDPTNFSKLYNNFARSRVRFY